jgi:hypothetical protein
MYYTSLKIIILIWQYGFVDTFTAVNFIYNAGAQYTAVVAAAMADGNVTKFPKVLFEPIVGLGVSYQFVKAAQTAAERKARVASLAILFAASGTTSVSSNPAANAGIGAAVAGHISHMREVLKTRGGSSVLSSEVKDFKIVLDTVKTPVLNIHPYRAEFTAKCKVSINNMFQDYRACRYLQGSTEKFKIVTPTCLKSPTYLTSIASVSTKTGLIGWTCLGLGVISFVTLGSLYLFHRVERKRCQNKNDEITIDVTASLSD